MVVAHRDQVQRIAEALIAHEVLTADDVERILAGLELAQPGDGDDTGPDGDGSAHTEPNEQG